MKMQYDLELEKIVDIIKRQQAKEKREKKKKELLVVLQFPDGLKQEATRMAEAIEKRTKAKCFVWLGSCFGSCDVIRPRGFDLVFSFGHSLWPFGKKVKAREIL
jgi:2-(3-amino-3-carboxypropyl)histidine synthase